MFTKEKLEKWIDTLAEQIDIHEKMLKQVETNKPLYDIMIKHKSNLNELKYTLIQIYTSITSDGSI